METPINRHQELKNPKKNKTFKAIETQINLQDTFEKHCKLWKLEQIIRKYFKIFKMLNL
jgi:hypothetical protein